ncbi:MAG: hypothetical protein ACOCUF_00860 [Patescibacteria group bacterium]
MHIGGALVSVFFPLLVNYKTVVFLGLGFFLLLLISKRKHFLNSVHNADEESIGALIFPLSVVLATIIFWPINVMIYQGSMLILGLSDGFGGLAGRNFGKRKYFVTGTKSLEGSAVFFIITAIILFLIVFLVSEKIYGGDILYILTGALLITLAEGFAGKGWDNLFVTLSAGGILYFLIYFHI